MSLLDSIFIPDDEMPDISQLPEDLQMMANEIGVPMTIKLAQLFAGTPIRTGGIKGLLRNHRNKMIRKACDEGQTILSLARKWTLDQRTVSKIANRVDDPASKQMRLWEVL